MEYIIIIAALAPIIAVLIMVSHNEILSRRSKKSLAASNPINMHVKFHKIPANISDQKSLFKKPWLVGLISLLCIIYVLPEAMSSSELTRMAIYKIVIGIGFFFFVLIQASISNTLNAIYEMKKADLGLIEAFLTNQKIRD